MKQVISTLAQLKEQYAVRRIPYQALLGTQEWRENRNIIVERDGWKCKKCSRAATAKILFDGKWQHILDVIGEYDSLYKIGNDYYTQIKERKIIFLDEPVILHVHHLYYEKAKYPWQYPEEALVTLCSDCHLEIHRKEVIPVYEFSGRNRMKLVVEVCSRCNGAGYFPQYNHVEAGICFACKGSRYTNLEL